jgi:nucleoside-diphosphate-sugar epimerase
MKKILVTGANGFIGSSLCNMLSERSLPFLGAVRKKNHENHFQIGNLSATTNWSNALLTCDTVIHLAARVHILNETSSYPLAAFRVVNVDATINLARQAVQYGVKRFIFVSSIAVNGSETKNAPFTVLDVPTPVTPYGQSKLEAEMALWKLSQETGLEVVVIRPPAVYGPGVQANFLKLMHLVRLGIPLPLGAIHNRRSMVALDNLVDLLILCIAHQNASGETFMISDDQDVSITELLRMLAHAMKKRSCLLPVPAKIVAGSAALFGCGTAANRLLASLRVDVNHTKLKLNWTPIAGLEKSLDKTVAHFLKNY